VKYQPTKKFRQIDGVLVEIPVDSVGRPKHNGMLDRLVSDDHYHGLKATDGTPIDSRERHRAYMRHNNLTTMDDFSDDFRAKARASQERENSRHRKQVIIDAVKQHER
jgi:hypothetical protein